MNKIKELEKDRIFCCHGLDHSLDVARIAYIISIEKNLNLSKNLIYTAAILHDIGRCIEGKDHNIHSAEISRVILSQCDYTDDEIDIVLDAVVCHRKDVKNIKTLSDVIRYADKVSRRCYACDAYDKCYWSEERKNKDIIY